MLEFQEHEACQWLWNGHKKMHKKQRCPWELFKEKTNEGIRPKINKNLHKFVLNTFLVWKFTGKGSSNCWKHRSQREMFQSK